MFTDMHIFKYNHEVVLALEKKKFVPGQARTANLLINSQTR